MSVKRSFHVSVDIRGALKRKNLAGLLISDSGTRLSDDEVREELIADLRAGHDVFCGCDNRAPNGACAGHEEVQT